MRARAPPRRAPQVYCDRATASTRRTRKLRTAAPCRKAGRQLSPWHRASRHLHTQRDRRRQRVDGTRPPSRSPARSFCWAPGRRERERAPPLPGPSGDLSAPPVLVWAPGAGRDSDGDSDALISESDPGRAGRDSGTGSLTGPGPRAPHLVPAHPGPARAWPDNSGRAASTATAKGVIGEGNDELNKWVCDEFRRCLERLCGFLL